MAQMVDLRSATRWRRSPVRWRRVYITALVGIDAILLLAASTIAALARWGTDSNVTIKGADYFGISIGLAALWILMLAGVRAYDRRVIGLGSDEFRRVFEAAVRAAALVAFITFVGKLPLSRGYVAMALPLGLIFTLVGRYASRRMLHRRQRHGECLHRVLAVGTPPASARLAAEFASTPHAGYQVVALWTPQPEELPEPDDDSAPREHILDVVAANDVDTVAVASNGLTPTDLRRLAWQLEGSGVDLLVSPSLTNIAGPRILIRPVAGLPLLHVDEPDLTGGRQLLKSAIDRVAATFLLLILSPLLLVVSVLIRATSKGPAMFRQERLGRHGETFRIYKFRTMYDGADKRFAELVRQQSENQGGMFVKHKEDPRITRVGHWLRRLSIDEIPQLFNVLFGHMSLVGPRPLPVAVAQEGRVVRRRLLVRPGMTGLWQISGRSDLSWEDAVRIDLFYVENWSLAFDLMILWKTVWVVFKGGGAY